MLQREVLPRKRPFDPVARLDLSDAGTWTIHAEDAYARDTSLRLKEAMGLPAVMPASNRPCRSDSEKACHLLLFSQESAPSYRSRDIVPKVIKFGSAAERAWHDIFPQELTNTQGVFLGHAETDDMRWTQVLFLAMVFAREIQARGGLLLHGALIERDGKAVILAGPGGVGKSTAARRIPPPWRALCDDVTLVIRDSRDNYRAHPWPTWSRFITGVSGGECEVHRGAPLQGIFFLSQDENDRVAFVDGIGRSACLLVESAEQGSWPMAQRKGKEGRFALRRERFANSCALAQALPCYHLRLSRYGAFWEAMEATIEEKRRVCA